MSLFFITGQAGTGKSAVCHELRRRGYEAFDADDNLARWVNKATGYVHPKSSVKAIQRTESFLQQHDWKIPRPAVEELAAAAENQTMFLCGVGGNEAEIRDLFKAMFALVVDDDTVRHRLATRTGNSWGKEPHELALTLGWQTAARRDYAKYGHLVIDATQPLEAVVDNIVQRAEQLENN